MKKFALLSALIIPLLVVAGFIVNDKSKSNEPVITFYEVPLICTAAPEIGCGTRTKPVLLEMENDAAIKEAWLNRQGTVYAIVWAGADKTDEIAKPLFEKYKIDFKKLNEKETKELLQSFRKNGKWYRGAEVDKLSTEEAGIIAKDAVTFALNEKLVSEQEADVIKVEIEKYLKTELVKTRTADELYSNEVTKQFCNDLSGIVAKVTGKDRAEKITELYMQTKPLEKIEKDGSCNQSGTKKDCCKHD